MAIEHDKLSTKFCSTIKNNKYMPTWARSAIYDYLVNFLCYTGLLANKQTNMG